MNWIIFFVSLALILQVGLLLWSRKIRKREKENSVIEKYDIRTRQRAWQLMADPDLPEEDREKIRRIYEGEDVET